MGRRNKLLYEAGKTADLSPEDQAMARAISEHMHLRHVHNALEVADVREGETLPPHQDGAGQSHDVHLPDARVYAD